MKFLLATLFFPLLSHAGSTTFQDIEKVLADSTRKIESVESLLAQPELAKGFLRGYTLMFASRSMQEASPLNPRAIVYGEDARLILAFNCAPGHCLDESNPSRPGRDFRGSDSAELIHWIPEKREFEFREITFPASGGGRAQISEANPRKCMGCHRGPDARPNWESYGRWPGAYGGAADHLAGDLVDGENPLKLRDFLAGAPTRARYQLLERLAEGFQSNGARDQNEHNSDITKFLFALNLQRIADRLRRMPEYPLLKYSIAYAVGFSGKLPLQIADAGFPALARTVEKCLVPRYEPGRQPQFTSVVSQLVRLAFAFGVDSSAWHMSFSPTLRSEANGNGNTDKEFFEVLRKDDPSVDLPWMELRSRASESWKALALRENLESGLVSCALALGPPYYP